ncbi:gasdermin-A3-like [Motacilla alba alba]|uniref:gasdermin-A3-like n=1 Tax=Motacilla alba alba TaxID=1094192 RepID=UPI0018D5955B|nr:gasdermin-A3-like [Motacilla alba alba]XP_038018966.1 gasdermin-A3-like [Motacilla alba alba]
MFKKLTKFIVNQTDPCKEWVPVESIADNEHFRPLCLLKRKSKPKTVFHRAPYYQQTGFTLDDVLLPGEDGKSIDSLHQESSQFTLTKVSADQADGGLSISFDPTNVELKGGSSLSKEFSITPQKKSVSLEALRRERKINMDHSFIRQLRRTDIRLYVVTAILEASEEAVYKESSKADRGFKAKFYATLCAQGNREDTQSIVIPKGCTLAFRTIPLCIRDGAWDLDYFPAEAVRKQAYVADGPSAGKLGEVMTEVQYSCRIFPELSPDLLLIIFNTIKAVMRDKSLLQELSQKMEEVSEQNDGYQLETESPDLKDLFSALQHCPRDRLLPLAEGITYVLDALHELTEHQLLLLLESLERKIVSQQLNLVENLLKHDLDTGKETFLVDATVLFSQEEEQRLTIALVELSGVQLQEDGSAVPRDQPFEAVAALFVVLYALNFLSGSGCFGWQKEIYGRKLHYGY